MRLANNKRLSRYFYTVWNLKKNCDNIHITYKLAAFDKLWSNNAYIIHRYTTTAFCQYQIITRRSYSDANNGIWFNTSQQNPFFNYSHGIGPIDNVIVYISHVHMTKNS